MSVSHMHMYAEMDGLQGQNYSPSYLTAVICNACLGTLFCGYNMGVYNSIGPYLEAVVFSNVSKSIVGLVATLVPIGAGLGAFLGNFLADRIGRFRAFVLTDIFSIIMTIFTISTDLDLLLIGRFCIGICVGLNFTLVPLYLKELVPPKTKMKIGSAIALFNSVGVLIPFLLGLNIPSLPSGSISQWWQIILAFPILFNIARLINLFRVFRFDTPFYYILHDQVIEATDVLSKINPSTEAEAQLFRLTQEKERIQHAPPLPFMEIISEKYRKPLVIGCLLVLFSQLSGINGLTFYSTFIMKNKEDEESKAPQVFTIIMGVVSIIAAILTNTTIEKFGRRTMLFLGEAALTALLAIMSIVGMKDPTSLIMKILLLTFVFIFYLSVGFATSIYLSEILTDLGLSCAVCTSWIFGSLVGIVYKDLLADWSQSSIFLMFAILSLFGTFFVLESIKETQGLSSFQTLNLYYKVAMHGSIAIPKNALLQQNFNFEE